MISSMGLSSSSSSKTTVRPSTRYTACRWAESLQICKNIYENIHLTHGPLTRFVKLRVAQAPGMPETCSPPTRVSDPDMHYGACVTHAGFPLKSVARKRSQDSQRSGKPQFYVYGKRPVYDTKRKDSLTILCLISSKHIMEIKCL